MRMWLDEKLNAICLEMKDATMDVKVPHFVFDFDISDTTIIMFDFEADYYIEKALDLF